MTTQTEKNILKGCGEKDNWDYTCGVEGLCGKCKSKLEGYQLAQKEKGDNKTFDIGWRMATEVAEEETAEKVEKLKAEVSRTFVVNKEIFEIIDKIFLGATNGK